jgi:hypothetical protein
MIRERFQFLVGPEIWNETVKFLDYMYKHSSEPGFANDFYDFVAKIYEIKLKQYRPLKQIHYL